MRMATFFLFCLIWLLQSCATTEQSVLRQSLIGEWISTTEKDAVLILNKDGTADLIQEGISITESVMQGRGYIRFYFDEDVMPMTLDLSMYTIYAEKMGTIRSIVKFIDKDTIQLATHSNDDAIRLKSFEGKNIDQDILYRKNTKALSLGEKSVTKFKTQCYSGNFRSCIKVASNYEEKAALVPKVEQKKLLLEFIEFRKKACNYGSFSSCMLIADHYDKGIVVERDLGKARDFLQKACDSGRGIESVCEG